MKYSLFRSIEQGRGIVKQLLLSVSLAAIACADVASAQSSTEVYDYDALGRLISVVTTGGANDGDAHAICYDAAGNRTSYDARSNRAIPACAQGSLPPPPPPPPTPTPTPSPTPSIAISNGSAVEGRAMSFTVTLSAASGSSVSVNYASANGTAGSGDFTAVSGALTFSAGQTSKSISVYTKRDRGAEADERFYINLSNPVGATIADSQGVGTILDDDDDPMCGNVFC